MCPCALVPHKGLQKGAKICGLAPWQENYGLEPSGGLITPSPMSPLAWTLPQIQEGESMPVYPGRPLGARPEGLAAANRLELLMRESKSRVLPLTPSRRVPGECPGSQYNRMVPVFPGCQLQILDTHLSGSILEFQDVLFISAFADRSE